MKAILIAGLFVLSGFTAIAQGLILVDSLNNVKNDDTIFVQINSSQYDLEIPVGVENTSASSVKVNVTRYEENVMPNTSSYFCWGVCTGVVTSGFFPEITPSGYVTMNSNITLPPNDQGFMFHYDPNSQAGTSLFKIRFFDVDSPNNYSEIYLSITSVDPTVGIEEHSTESPMFFPNPTNGEVHVNLTQPQIVQVINTRGQVLVSTTSNKIDLSDFPSGMYYLKLEDGIPQKVIRK